MGLSELHIPKATIDYAGGFDVRGLSVADIALLAGNHRADIDRLIDSVAGTVNGDKSDESVLNESVLERALSECPVLFATAIACANDEPDQWQLALQLPFPVQLDAVMQIARLTFEEAGGIKKCLENLVSAMQVGSQTLQAMRGKTGIKH